MAIGLLVRRPLIVVASTVESARRRSSTISDSRTVVLIGWIFAGVGSFFPKRGPSFHVDWAMITSSSLVFFGCVGGRQEMEEERGIHCGGD